MNLYDRTENAALGDELILLIDKWPNCNQERAIELQEAFNRFSEEGGWEHPEVSKWGPRNGPIYVIKRDPERTAHYMKATNALQDEITRRHE